EFQGNSFTTNEPAWPSIAALPGGGFAIAWQSQQDGSGYGIYGQLFDAEGDKVGQETWLSTVYESNESRPQIVADGDGLIAVWNSDRADADNWGVLIRSLPLPAQPVY